MSPTDPVWDELGKIDYLLDQVARSVDRGEISRTVYDQLAPRYLERRADLADVLRRRAVPVAPVPLPRENAGVTTEYADRMPERPSHPVQAQVPSASVPTRAPGMPFDARPTAAAPAGAAPAAAPVPARVPVAPNAAIGEDAWWSTPGAERGPNAWAQAAPAPAISAGAWMTFAGAFLVVVAVAIFTIYAWATMPVLVKLAVLLGVTVMFYVAGEVVRTRMELPAAGIALTGVGSAMLLFDGWAVINGFNMTGAGPWAALLLLCSLAYWATELRIAGGWFGAVGAAAQVGWWWLLGQALHVPTEWQIAGVAVVALLWALGGARVRHEGPLAALGVVLRGGSVVLAGLMSLAMLLHTVSDVGAGSMTVVLAAFVTAVAASAVIELRAPNLRPVSAALHAPVLIALFATTDAGGVAIMCGVFALLYAVYAVVRGGAGYAALATVAAWMCVSLTAQRFAWEPTSLIAALAALFAVATIGGFLLSRRSEAGAAIAGGNPVESAGAAWHVLGLAALALVTFVGVPWSAGGLPLAAVRVTANHALLAAWLLVMWILTVTVTRREAAGWILFAWSFYSLAAVAAYTLPDLHSAWYACALLAAVVLWRHAEPLSSRALSVDSSLLLAVCRLLLLAVPLLGMAGSAVFFNMRDVPTIVLFVLAALAWAADAVRSKEWVALVPAAAFASVAGFVYGWYADSVSMGGIWAAAVGAVLTLVAAFGPRRQKGWGMYLAAGAVLPATVALIAAFPDVSHLAAALALVSVAWALTAVAADLPVLFGVAGVSASFTLLATLWWRDPSPVVSYVSYSLLAALLFAPAVFRSGLKDGLLRRAARPLATASLATMGQFALLGFIQMSVGQPDIGTRALQLGQPGLAYGLLAFGALAVLWSALEQVEVGDYIGYGAMLLGALTFMDYANVRQAEFYLIAIALYALAMGVLYTVRDASRAFPAAADAVAFVAAVVVPYLMSIGSFQPQTALEHGLWALFLAIVAIVGGLMTRTKLHFLGGITIAALESLYLSRDVLLALPTWVYIGIGGFVLIFGGVKFARRELLGQASERRTGSGFIGWR